MTDRLEMTTEGIFNNLSLINSQFDVSKEVANNKGNIKINYRTDQMNWHSGWRHLSVWHLPDASYTLR